MSAKEYKVKILLSTFNAKYIHSSLGAYSIAAFCRSRIYSNVQVKEYTIQTPILNVLADIYKEKPAVLGIGAYIWNRNVVLELAQLVKQILPDTIIIIGGPEASNDIKGIFSQAPDIDFIILGEGEETFLFLLEAIEKKIDIKKIEGIAYKNKNEIITQGSLQIVKDLSVLEFPYNNILNDNTRIFYYESTRGCPFTCAYCLSGVSHNVRMRPLEKVFKDMDKFIDAKVRQVKFVDRTYNLDKKHYLPLMRYLAGKNTQTNFHFEVKADLLDDEVLEFLKTVPEGRFQFEIGIQSTNLETLVSSGRNENLENTKNNIQIIKTYKNIHLHLDLIAGLPYETYDIFKNSFNEVYSLNPEMLQLGFLKLLKGSSLESKKRDYQYQCMGNAPYEILSNAFISYEEVRRLKIIEDVLESLYNSGKFQNTLKYLIAIGISAFDFYEKISFWWEKNDLHMIIQNAKNNANNLHQYIKDNISLYNYNEFLDVLKLDILLYHEKSFRPDYINWLNPEKGTIGEKFWRSEETVQKYIENYKFTSWRNIKNEYALEKFEYYFPANDKLKYPVYLLFFLQKKAVKSVDIFDF